MQKNLLTSLSKAILTFEQRGGIILKVALLTVVIVNSNKLVAQANNSKTSDNNTLLFGKVVEEKSKGALEGASVHIKGTTHEVLTDNEGGFKFVTAQKLPVTFIVSYVGYQTNEITFKDNNNIYIELKDGTNALNEVVVVGYGTQRKSDVTGSVAAVSKNLLSQPSASFDNLLQGAVPGVAVTQSSSQPGSTATIRIRGGNSISFGNDPLYVIDGFIVYNNNSYANTGASNGVGINALATINPSDIQSIEVLKDASATAIYGSRGANGVVLITTRRGKKSGSEVNYSTYTGVQKVSKKLGLLNGAQWASLINDVNLSDSKPKTFSDSAIAALGIGSNWQDAAIKDATIQNHELSFSGGDDKSRFLLSGNYYSQGGTIVNTGFRRYSARLNYERNISDKLKLATNIFGSQSIEDKLFGNAYNSSNFQSSAFANLLLLSPVARIYNENGSYNTSSPYSSTPTNLLQDISTTTNRSYLNRILGNLSLEYKILKDLNFKFSAGADLFNARQNYYSPSFAGSPAGNSTGFSTQGYAAIGSANAVTWINENLLTYDHTFNKKHFLNILAGYTMQHQKDNVAVAAAQKFPNDLTKFNNLNFASTPVLSTSDAHESAINSYLARVNYSLLHKYNLSLSVRSDGASKLGANNRWGFFPSVGFSWNAGEEEFFEKYATTISSLKFRLSAGRTGNSEVPPYSSLAALTPTNYYFSGALVTGISPTQIANADLKWETTSQYNAGVDLALAKNRINLSFDAYLKRTSDLLLNVPFPLYTGYASSLQNVGSVENKGVELSITSDNLKGRNISWKTTLVVAANRNKIVSLGKGTDYYFPLAPTGYVSPVIVKVGLPVGTFWGYNTAGLLTANDIAKGTPVLNGVSQQEGDRRYIDTNGDGVVNTNDKHSLGTAQPTFTFGFNNSITVKNFDLSFFFQGSYGNKVFNFLQQKLEIPTLSLNASSTLLDRWTTQNQNGKIPKATNAPVSQVADVYVEDASFIKLKNVSLGYTFSKGILSKMGAKQLRLYVSAQNLLTITRYTGYDPEVNFFDGDNTKQGIDYGAYLSTRALLGGLNITF